MTLKHDEAHILMRVDRRLRNEITTMKEARKDNGLNDNSDRFITSLIPKHILWPKIKSDIENFVEGEDGG